MSGRGWNVHPVSSCRFHVGSYCISSWSFYFSCNFSIISNCSCVAVDIKICQNVNSRIWFDPDSGFKLMLSRRPVWTSFEVNVDISPSCLNQLEDSFLSCHITIGFIKNDIHLGLDEYDKLLCQLWIKVNNCLIPQVNRIKVNNCINPYINRIKVNTCFIIWHKLPELFSWK